MTHAEFVEWFMEQMDSFADSPTRVKRNKILNGIQQRESILFMKISDLYGISETDLRKSLAHYKLEVNTKKNTKS